jgi:predicted ABC-type ATPase
VADLLVVTGPPGAGKSTVAELVLASFTTAALVPGDLFFSFRRGGPAPWLPEADEDNAVALRAAAAAAGTFAAAACQVVYDGVVGPWFMRLFADEVSGRGVRVPGELHYVVLLPSLERCRHRVADRAGHAFTDAAATARMHAEFAAADVDPRHLLADPPDAPPRAPADVARRVLERYASGDLRYRPAA